MAPDRVAMIALTVLASCARTTESRRAPTAAVVPSLAPASAPASSSASASPPEPMTDTTPGLPPEYVAAAPGTPLASNVASKAAKALGLKASIGVPYPVRCPVVAKPAHEVSKMTATGKLAELVVALDAFLSEEMGVPEAVELLGVPALCNASPGLTSGYMNLHLAPKHPNVHAATIETHDMDMIGLSIDFEKTVAVDVTSLASRYGRPKRGPAPLDSFEAGSDDFSPSNASYRGQLVFSHRQHHDPPSQRQVHHILLRRTAIVDIQPEGFRAEADVVRLAAMALQPKMRDAVSFAGTLGGYAKPVNGTITFDAAIPVRNVKRASVGVTSNGERHRVRSLDVVFATPIAGVSPASFARALGPMTRSPSPPIVSTDGNHDRIQTALGKVTLQRSSGALQSMTVERTD